MPLLEVLLVSHRKQRLDIGILGGLAPTVNLLKEQPSLAATPPQLSRIQVCGLY